MNCKSLLIIRVLLMVAAQTSFAQSLELKNNYFYIDGEKFFVKGIGYEASALPGQVPWEKTFNPTQLHYDIPRIISAGYNTIRTWAHFTEEELAILSEYDIKIIMGIWIDPHGDFSDPNFINQAKNIVSNVLSYSKNYDNIIAYVIMNEPLPEAVFNAGLEESISLWKSLIEIINNAHPSRPVSIANTPIGTYIGQQNFDFSAFNVYIYNPVTVNHLHGYRDFTSYLKELTPDNIPLIITEYGLSVSPTGPGNWGYGGNSLTEQQDGIIHMYKSLVDGGASGSCVFIYSDGWWKADNEFVHDDAAEEWFGLIEYTALSDTRGTERPAWGAVKNFQSAIITQPQSSEIYNTQVPIELFLSDTIDRIEIWLDSSLVYNTTIGADYWVDTLIIDSVTIKDALLEFRCFDSNSNLVKSEKKSILITKELITLPSLEIEIKNANFWSEGNVQVDYLIDKTGQLTCDPTIDYVYYPHDGFQYGNSYHFSSEDPSYILSSNHSISNHINVITIGAALDASYGNFKKRIFNQGTYIRSSTSSDRYIQLSETVAQLSIFPNPANYETSIGMYLAEPSELHIELLDISGRQVKTIAHGMFNAGQQEFQTNVAELTTGIYLCRYNVNQKSSVVKLLITD
ncbi:MAG TPA: hypothetical protein DDX98_01285 [Bacteroidales bacterium]|jgi:hypothetical protein|nr:hypothetical protein [Bacteroidales bacterium]